MKASACAILGVILLGQTGCRHARVAEAGRTSFAFVEPRASVARSSGDREMPQPTSRSQYVEAQVHLPVVEPVYPRRALAAKAGVATVGVRITVNTEGRVSAVAPSILSFTTPGPYADDFFAAVEQAVRQWKFSSAEIRDIEAVVTPELSYSRVTRREKTEAQFELCFTFMANGGLQVLPAGK